MTGLYYHDAAQTTVRAEMPDGSERFVPAGSPVLAAIAAEIGAATGSPPQVQAWTAPAPTIDDVVAERTRRMAAGFDYDFGNGRGVHRIGTTPSDLAGWREVTELAAAAIACGRPEMEIHVVTDSGAVAITAMEWQAILLAAAAFRQPLWAASFILQAMDPIPENYADDLWWPGSA